MKNTAAALHSPQAEHKTGKVFADNQEDTHRIKELLINFFC
jgi:hypothetical protein